METKPILDKLKTLIGQEIGISDWFLVDQDRINQFAACTDDHQWIHVDAARAARGPFGTTIAHGFLTLSLIPAMSQCIQLPLDPDAVQMSINYGLNQVRFIQPVPVNSEVRSRVVLTGVEERAPGRMLLTYKHTLEIKGQAKPACVAELLALMVLKP